METTPRYVHTPYSFEGLALVAEPEPITTEMKREATTTTTTTTLTVPTTTATTTTTRRKSSLKDRMQPPPVAVGSDPAAAPAAATTSVPNTPTPKNHVPITLHSAAAIQSLAMLRSGLGLNTPNNVPSPAMSLGGLSSTRSSVFVQSSSEESMMSAHRLVDDPRVLGYPSPSVTPTNKALTMMGRSPDPYSSLCATPTSRSTPRPPKGSVRFPPSACTPSAPNTHMRLVEDLLPASVSNTSTCSTVSFSSLTSNSTVAPATMFPQLPPNMMLMPMLPPSPVSCCSGRPCNTSSIPRAPESLVASPISHQTTPTTPHSASSASRPSPAPVVAFVTLGAGATPSALAAVAAQNANLAVLAASASLPPTPTNRKTSPAPVAPVSAVPEGNVTEESDDLDDEGEEGGDGEDMEDGCEEGGKGSAMCSGPCAHTTKWKRLRAKRGYGYYVCLLCGAKWKTTSAARRAANSINQMSTVNAPTN